MALEAAVYNYTRQEQVNYGCKGDFYSFAGEDDQAVFGVLDNNIDHQLGICANWDSSSPSVAMNKAKDQWDPNSSPEACAFDHDQPLPEQRLPTITMEPPAGRRKRRRTRRSTKNKEEIENQRMTHIAVERNRRKQMNDYLAVLRSLMPSSYVQRGDQASTIGGAINYLKELEQLLQSMEAHKRTKQNPQLLDCFSTATSPFADFFSFPQYSTRTAPKSPEDAAMAGDDHHYNQWPSVADIEVTMVESHANLKILSKKRPGQLLKMVVGLQGLWLSIMHLNITSVDQLVLYSVSVKVEEGCHLNSVDDIAAAVNQMMNRIEEETFSADNEDQSFLIN